MPGLTPDMQRVLGLALLILNVALYAGAFRARRRRRAGDDARTS